MVKIDKDQNEGSIAYIEMKDESSQSYNYNISNNSNGQVNKNNNCEDKIKPVLKESNEEEIIDFMRKYFQVRNELGRKFLAELLSTFILVTFGCASIAQFKFMNKRSPNDITFLSVNISFGIGAAIGALVAGKISGAHMNPAVTLAMLVRRRMSIKRFFTYLIAQFLGAFLAAVIVFIVYIDGFNLYGKTLETASVFGTYPSKNVTIVGGFLDQLVSSALLVIAILAITDRQHSETPHATASVLVGLTILIIGSSFGFNSGFAVNPARDFGPRLFTLIAGWGSIPFTAGNYFFWIPLIGPMAGSFFGTLIYTLAIEINWP